MNQAVFPPFVSARKVLSAGVALLFGAFAGDAQAQNLIHNGGFETGDFLGWTVTPAAIGSDFGVAGETTLFTVNGGALIQGEPGPITPFKRDSVAFFGATAGRPDAISQTFHTISRGPLRGVYRVSFDLSFYLSSADMVGSSFGYGGGQFQALWNGRAAYSQANGPTTNFQKVSFTEVATSKSSTLTLQSFAVTPFYLLDDVSVSLVGLEESYSQFARSQHLSPNQSAVAETLDSVVGNPKGYPLLTYLDSLPLHTLPGALDRISPEELTSIFTASIAYAQEQSLNLQRRTEDIRSGASGFSAANLAINGDNPFYSGGFDITTGVAGPNGSDGKEVKETKEVTPAENRWGTFLSGTGEWVNVSGTDNAHGYDLASGGFTLGVDYKVCPNFAIGLAAGYTGTTADLSDHGRVWTNGGKLGLYSTVFSGGWYADIAGFGGYNGYDTRRSALDGDARGSTHGGEVDALFGTGYDFKKGNLTFGPTASFNYTYAGMNGFTEHNSLVPLDIHGNNVDSLRTAFGFKVSYDCKVGGVVIKPELRAAWQHEFGDTAYSLDSSFANGAGSPFSVDGPRFGRDSALIGAGVAVQLNDRCTAYLYYDGELGRQNYESNSVTGGFRVAF
ncbi:MAG TPA: autotransporter domain-containing protein [Chthoniobacter sp.]|jgi:outer membrane autotransporter protein